LRNAFETSNQLTKTKNTFHYSILDCLHRFKNDYFQFSLKLKGPKTYLTLKLTFNSLIGYFE